MGPELMLAVVGPIVGGAISIIVWVNRRNYESMNTGFNQLNTTINVIERKVDDIRIDVAKNYVTDEELFAHIERENGWRQLMGGEISAIREEISKVRDRIEKA